MPPLSPCRTALLQSTRLHLPRTLPRGSAVLHQQQQRRAASTKHPRGFAPPTQDDLSELRERTVEFVRREIPTELAQSTDHDNAFPNDLWRKFGDAGFLGITADEDYGGLAMGYQAHCVVMEELSRASGSIGLSYAAHSQLCVNQMQLNGNEEQKQELLPGLLSGEKIGALAMSEHTAGSDVVSMKMSAKEVDGGFVLNGTKMWITNGPDAHVRLMILFRFVIGILTVEKGWGRSYC